MRRLRRPTRAQDGLNFKHFLRLGSKTVNYIQLIEKSTQKHELTPRRAGRAGLPAKLFSGSGAGQARLRRPTIYQMTQALAYARRALTRERKRAFHKMSSNVPSAPSRVAVAEALFVPSVPIFPPAWGAEVVSSNIVGYEKITITPGLNMIGNQFLAVGGDSFQNINEMFKDSSEMVAGADDSQADSILRWTGNGYGEIYYYDDIDVAWESVDAIGVVSTETFAPGSGFWFKHVGNETITTTFAGEVPTESTYTVNLVPGLNFVANPYPAAICPNSDSFTIEGAVAGADDSAADSILMWTGTGYGNIYYYDDIDIAWESVDAIGVPITDTILEPAKGFWYKHQGTGATLTFGKPY